MKTKISKIAAFCLAAVMSLGVATGCNGGTSSSESSSSASSDKESSSASESSSAAESTDSSSSAADNTELTKLKLQVTWLPQGEFMGYYVAQAKGYYAEEGIDVEIIPGSSDISSPDQVENGVADLGVCFYTNLLTYQEGGYDVVNVAQFYQKTPLWMISKKEKGIESAADFKGKRIGNWFGGQQFELYALCSKYGLDIDTDVTWVQQDFTMDAFYDDELDVASVFNFNEYHLVLEAGYSPDDLHVININDEGIAMLQGCLFADRQWAANNKDLLVRFIRASVKGWKDACANPEEAGQIVWDAGQSVSLEHQITMCQEVASLVCPDGYDPALIGNIDLEKVQNTIDLGLQYKLISTAIDPATSVDNSYWEEATKDLS